MPHLLTHSAYSEFHTVLTLFHDIDTLKLLPPPKCRHNYNFVLGFRDPENRVKGYVYQGTMSGSVLLEVQKQRQMSVFSNYLLFYQISFMSTTRVGQPDHVFCVCALGRSIVSLEKGIY